MAVRKVQLRPDAPTVHRKAAIPTQDEEIEILEGGHFLFRFPAGSTYFKSPAGSGSVQVSATIREGNVALPSVLVSAADVTSTVYSSIRIGEIRDRVTEDLRSTIRDRVGRDHHLFIPPRIVTSLRARAPRRGPGAKSPEYYRKIAQLYLAMLLREPRRVVMAMAAKLDLPRSTVSSQIRRAREEGWLSMGSRGKAGAEPGPKLTEWLKSRRGNDER